MRRRPPPLETRTTTTVAVLRTATLLAAVACAPAPPERLTHPIGLTAADSTAVRSVDAEYVDAWLAGDSARVMALLEPDAVILPGGVGPIQGPEAIRAFWWPESAPPTVIESYRSEIDGIGGSGGTAWIRGQGELAFTWTGDGGEQRIESRNAHLTVVRRRPDGSWGIVARAWSQLD